MRKSGIDVIGDCAWGTHFCQFYQTSQDLADILVPYFKAGLEDNEACMWVTSPELTERQAETALRQAAPGFDSYQRRGQIEILPHSDWYLRGGAFDLDRVLSGWLGKLEEALSRGFDGLRLSGNTAWLEKRDWKAFTEYEGAVNSVIGSHRMIALCTYSLERCNALEVLDVVRNHQFALIKSEKGWDRLENSDLKRARENLLSSENRYQALFSALNEGFALHEIICDGRGVPIDYRFLEVNPAFERLTGLKREAVVGRTVRQILPDIEPFWINTYGKVALTGQPAHFESHNAHLDKSFEVMAYSPGPGRFAALFLDVSDRRRRDEELKAELREKSGFLEASYRHSLDALVFLDRHFNFIRVNEAYARACLRDASEFPGHNHFEFYPNQENQAIFEEVVRSGRPYQAFAKPFIFPDHPEFGVTYWDWTLVPILDQRGEVDFLVFSLRDVTERHKAEVELRAASQYARNLLEASLDPLVTISPDGRITDVNRATEAVTGIERESLIGSSFSEYFTEPQQANEGYRKVIAEGEVRDYPLTIRHVSGRTTDVLYNATVYRDQSGQTLGIFAAARDVTELRASEKRRDFTNALLELFARKSSSKEYLDSVVEVIRNWSDCQALGVRVADDHAEISYESWLGFEPGFIEKERCLSLDRDQCSCVRVVTKAVEPQDRPALTPGGSFRFDNSLDFLDRLPPELRSRYRGNCMKYGYASLAIIPIRYRDQTLGAIHLADRRPEHFSLQAVEFIESITPLIGEAIHRFRAEAELARYRDRLEELVKQRTAELEAANAQLQLEISERRRAEETLRQTAAELARSNHDLEQFAYVASHDLQEPLRAVAGYVELLQHRYQDTLDDRAQQFITGAVDGAARMQRLVTDLLAFSRVGTHGANFASSDLNAALGTALASLKVSIREAGAKITSDSLPTLRIDATQIAQVFQNLIGNAIKFRGSASPAIHVGAVRQPGRWLLSVRDNGIGLDPQYAERIFLIFQRLHTRRKYPGTGIGLAICKRIVERHGGEIWVESQPGQGSTFYFFIPDRSD